VQFSTESVCRLFQGVAEIDLHASRPANPSPLPDKGPCAKQIRLYAQQVVAVLIPLGIARFWSLVNVGVITGELPLAALLCRGRTGHCEMRGK
jgi:hypothetical protein